MWFGAQSVTAAARALGGPRMAQRTNRCSPLTMKALLLLLGAWAVVAETDVNPPVISLDLTQQIRPVVESAHASLPCQTAPNSGYCRSRSGTNAEGNSFQEQYARVCHVFDTVAKCATPTATALDHHEGELGRLLFGMRWRHAAARAHYRSGAAPQWYVPR